jgi:hypothetical protein
MLLAKLAISYRNIFTFFDKLKEIFKFWASGCHVKSPLPPPTPHTRCCYGELCALGQLGGRNMAGPIYLPMDAGFARPRPPMTWIFGTFCRVSQKGIIVGRKSWSKKYRENTSPEYNFLRIFLLQRFLSCKHSKKRGHIWPGLWKIGLKHENGIKKHYKYAPGILSSFDLSYTTHSAQSQSHDTIPLIWR